MKSSKKGLLVIDAAKALGIGPKKLRNLLRTKKLFSAGNWPRYERIEQGLFTLEQRSYNMPNSGAPRPYHVALVTPNGMAYLRDLIDEMATTPLQHQEQQRLPSKWLQGSVGQI